MQVQYGPLQTNLYSQNIEAVQVEGMWKSYLCNWVSELHKLMIDIQTIRSKVDSQNGNSREH